MGEFHELIDYSLTSYGPVSTYLTPSKQDLEDIEKSWPAPLVDLVKQRGFLTFHDGLFRLAPPSVIQPIVDLVIGNDPDLGGGQCVGIGYNAFGALTCWSNRLFDVRIELPLQNVYCFALTNPINFQGMSADDIAAGIIYDKEDAEFFDVNDQPLYDRCVQTYGPLAADECYGFVPALAFLGEAELENIKRMKAREHFAILAQFGGFSLMELPGNGIIRPKRLIG